MNPVRPPSVDALIRTLRRDPRFETRIPVDLIAECAKSAVKNLRGIAESEGDFAQWASDQLLAVLTQSVRPAINATGVLLHTGLGRARLAPEAQIAVGAVAAGHASVELDLTSGGRGDRQNAVRHHLVSLSKSEDAFVVNNCAGAVFLCLAALCHGREVLLSRGQMVEIGGSYRMPEIVSASGAHLVEAGCTNKTHLSDYSSHIGAQTAAIVRCHRSNFTITGFTDEPTPAELSEVARQHSVLFLDDLGSGCFLDTTKFGLPKERTVQEAVADGADLVMFSGDKLLGGPQAGIIVGRKDLVQRVKSHPLARALRPDKLNLAALEATLCLYRTGREGQIPVWKYAARSLETIRAKADRIAGAIPDHSVIEAGRSVIGGGSMPDAKLPTFRVGIRSEHLSAGKVAELLRAQDVPIITTVSEDRCWIDPRTIEEDELEIIVDHVVAIMFG